MVKKFVLSHCFFLCLIAGCGIRAQAQESPDLHVVVNMVQLNVAVTDKNGKYITGLRPQDFAVVEDGIAEKVATFGEGNEPVRSLLGSAEPVRSANTGDELIKDSTGDPRHSLDALI